MKDSILKEKMVELGIKLEESIGEIFGTTERPVFILALQLPYDPYKYEYISTASRSNGIKLLRETADSMERRLN